MISLFLHAGLLHNRMGFVKPGWSKVAGAASVARFAFFLGYFSLLVKKIKPSRVRYVHDLVGVFVPGRIGCRSDHVAMARDNWIMVA